MPIEPQSTALPYSPARVASNGSTVMVADRAGTLLFWSWPEAAGPVDPVGPVIKAHGEGGPVAAVDLDFASSGGWDPAVTLWDGNSLKARYHLRPFDGRVTALAAQGDHLLVAGANRAPAPVHEAKRDRVYLQPGQLLQVAPDGQSSQLSLPVKGQITALSAGKGWVAAIDSAQEDRLFLMRYDRPDTLMLQDGPAIALAAVASTLYVADLAGVWSVDVDTLIRRSLAAFTDDSLRILMLQAVGDALFGATSEGLIRWPGADLFQDSGRQPASLARHGEHLLVLWAGGLLEQRDSLSGKVVATARVPSKI